MTIGIDIRIDKNDPDYDPESLTTIELLLRGLANSIVTTSTSNEKLAE